MPNLVDPNFDHTVTYMLEHNEEGAMGLTINRAGDYPLEDIFSQLDLPTDNEDIQELQNHQNITEIWSAKDLILSNTQMKSIKVST